MANSLQSAYEQFLIDGDQKALLRIIGIFGGHEPHPEVGYPIAHRICDIGLHDEAYRVLRVYDLDDNSTKVFIYPIDHPDFDRPGVPYERQSQELRQWILDEIERQAEEDDD